MSKPPDDGRKPLGSDQIHLRLENDHNSTCELLRKALQLASTSEDGNLEVVATSIEADYTSIINLHAICAHCRFHYHMVMCARETMISLEMCYWVCTTHVVNYMSMSIEPGD